MDFNGFPSEGLAFLQELEAHNEKPWFDANKNRYQEQLLRPAQAFVLAVGKRLQAIAPAVQYDTRTNGSGTLMRIHRDTRFSQDKTPYKTHVDGLFWEGEGKKTERPAFGFRLTTDGMGLMAGIFGFPQPALAAYRRAVQDDRPGQELVEIIARLAAAGYEVAGEHYKRVPAGLDPGHPRADLLRHDGLYAFPPAGFGRAAVSSPSLVDACMAHFQAMAPLQRWLVRALG